MEGLLRKAQKMRETFVLTLDASGKFNARLKGFPRNELLPPLDPSASLEPLDELILPGIVEPSQVPDNGALNSEVSELGDTQELAEMTELDDDDGLEMEAEAIDEKSQAASSADDDQADILRQIDEVVAQTKIKVTPETFLLKANHRGSGLPLLVNLGAIVLVAIGIGTMYLVFNQNQQTSQKAVVQLKPAEGKLIEEIKKQNDASIAAKQKEIEDIQSKLGDIAKQRDTLQTDMDSRVAAKTAELRRSMNAELEAERKRLQAQGLSETEITKRLQAFEQRKNDEYVALLNAFKIQVDSTRKQNELALQAKEAEFNQVLSKANQEKESIAADSKKREDELRKQLAAQAAQSDQAAAQAAAQVNQSQSQLSDAAAQIQKLAQARDQEKQIAIQIAGFYSTTRDQLREKKLEQAAGTLNLLKDYLNSDQVANLENLRQQRDTDLFVIDSLGGFIDREIKGIQIAASNQMVADNLKAQEAATAAAKETQIKYEAQISKLQADADAVQKKLTDLMSTQDKTSKDQLASRDRLLAERDKTIADLNAQREALTKRASGLEADLAKLRETNEGQAKSIAEFEKTIANQNAEIDRQKLVAASVTGSQAELGERLRAMDSQINDLKIQNQTIADQLKASAQNLERVQASLATTQAERDASLADGKTKDAQILALTAEGGKNALIAATYGGMVQSWVNYVQADKDLRQKYAAQLASGTVSSNKATAAAAAAKLEDTRTRETKVLLDTFLAGDPLRKAFPDLLERVKSYDKAFENAGAENITLNVADQVYAVASFETRAERLAYVKDQLAKTTNPGLKDFYQNLYDLIDSQPIE